MHQYNSWYKSAPLQKGPLYWSEQVKVPFSCKSALFYKYFIMPILTSGVNTNDSSLTTLFSILACFFFANISPCVSIHHLWQHCSLYWHASSSTTFAYIILSVLACFIFDNISAYVGILNLSQHCSLLACFTFDNMSPCVGMFHLDNILPCVCIIHLWQHMLKYIIFDNIFHQFGILYPWQHSFLWCHTYL